MGEYVEKVKGIYPAWKSRLCRLDIELTERCNNDCIHCYINLPAADTTARKREMSTEQIKVLLTEAAGLGCLQVRFTGGEPLLRPNFSDLYLFARRLGLKVLLFTNATLIDEDLAALFARIPPLVPIEVSVYGMRKESYEAVTRSPGSFARFQCGVSLLLEKQVPFIVKMVLLPPNRREIDEFESWAKTLPGFGRKPSYSMFFELRGHRDNPEKNALIKSFRFSPEQGMAVIAREAEGFRQHAQQFAMKFMGKPDGRLFACGAGKGLCIDAYGNVQPCHGVRAPELCPSLAHLPLTGALAAALKQMETLGSLRSHNPAYLERCARCFLKGFCEQCPAKSWAEHGDLDTPVDYFCELAQEQARFMGWLRKEEKPWGVTGARERLAGLSDRASEDRLWWPYRH